MVKIKKKEYNQPLFSPGRVYSTIQVLVGPSKQLKQIFQVEHNIVENPNWPEAIQLAIYKRGRGSELGATAEKQIQVVDRAELEPGTVGLKVRHADHLATLPPQKQWALLNTAIRCLSLT